MPKTQKREEKKKQKVAVIGAGRGGVALLKLLSGYPDLELVSIAEVDDNAPGLKLARQMGIPITRNYQDFAKMKDLDLVINVTGDPSVSKYLGKEKKGSQEILGGVSAKLLWNLVYNLKCREEDLNSTKEYLENILENSADIIITTSLEGKIVSFNKGAERILAYKRKEIIGKNVEILWKNKEKRKKLLQQFNQEGFVSNYETELLSKERKAIYVLLTLSHLKNQEGKVIGTVGISKDISEKKNMEVELIRGFRDMEDFVYTISHDLQTPLRAIYGFSKLLEEKYVEELDKTGIHYLERVRKGAERMKNLIDDLLALSRINMQKSRFEMVNMGEMLQMIEELFLLDLRSRGGELRYPKTLPSIFCDGTRIEQVFINLISNALKFCKKKPLIEIGYTERKEAHEFYVKDNGIGIPSRYQSKIFDVFQRLHNDTDEYEGTGIGLTIIKKIIDLHLGEIWLESVPDKGTIFYFSIPRDLPADGKIDRRKKLR